jgi:hypothetical protein
MRELGPYAAIALVLPGGSLIALAVWIFQRRAMVVAALRRLLVVAAAMGGALLRESMRGGLIDALGRKRSA